jgi:hypothetical protein
MAIPIIFGTVMVIGLLVYFVIMFAPPEHF